MLLILPRVRLKQAYKGSAFLCTYLSNAVEELKAQTWASILTLLLLLAWPSSSSLSSRRPHCSWRILIASTSQTMEAKGYTSLGQCLDCSKFSTNITLSFANAEDSQKVSYPLWYVTTIRETHQLYDFCFVFQAECLWVCIMHTALNIKSNAPHWRDWPNKHLLVSPSSCPYVCLHEEQFLFLR